MHFVKLRPVDRKREGVIVNLDEVRLIVPVCDSYTGKITHNVVCEKDRIFSFVSNELDEILPEDIQYFLKLTPKNIEASHIFVNLKQVKMFVDNQGSTTVRFTELDATGVHETVQEIYDMIYDHKEITKAGRHIITEDL